jgi:hypothetical protein
LFQARSDIIPDFIVWIVPRSSKSARLRVHQIAPFDVIPPLGEPKTITLITIDDLARLVQLRPGKQLGLQELRGLFQCRLPAECKDWIDQLTKKKVIKPPYAKIVSTIELLQRKRSMAQVSYSALANELTHAAPPIEYKIDDELRDVCKAMALMAPGSMFASFEAVQLETSAANVIAAIDAATKEWNDSA